MDNLRFVLFVLFAYLSFELYQTWQFDYGPKPIIPAAAQQLNNAGGGSASSDAAAIASNASQRVHVVTDVMTLELDSAGGDVRVLELPAYPQHKDQPDKPVRLLSDDDATRFVAQSGFLPGELGDDAPSHLVQWNAQANDYRLADGQDSLRVPLTWTDGHGISVTKTYTFKRGSYLVQVEHNIDNQSGKPWHARQYAQLQRKRPASSSDSQFVRTYTGAVYYTTDDKYKKVTFDDMADGNLNRSAAGGWFAMIQHYFLAAWVPPADQNNTYYTKALGEERYLIGAYSPAVEVAPGQKLTTQLTLFTGPKLQGELESIAPGLELAVDYGALTAVAKPIFWLMNKFHGIYGNWGFAIMSTTLVIKLLFYKLSESSYRSMANMRKLQPRLQALKEKHGDDRQAFNHAMIELYRKEKVNPLGGCLPILIQIPVFISLYWVLIESVEMRQAPFLLWLDDLSAMDPFFVLPLLMGVSMWLQQKLSPSSLDPIQQRVMQMMPFMFTVFFAFFPSGLVLYWVVNNTLSIIQQWHITKQIEKAA